MVGSCINRYPNSEDEEFIEVKNESGAAGLVPLAKLRPIDPSRRHLEEVRSPARGKEENDEEGEEDRQHDDLWARAKDNLKKKVLISNLLINSFSLISISH